MSFTLAREIDPQLLQTVDTILDTAGLADTAGWIPTGQRHEYHDSAPVIIMRYQPDTQLRLGGPHLSVTLARRRQHPFGLHPPRRSRPQR